MSQEQHDRSVAKDAGAPMKRESRLPGSPRIYAALFAGVVGGILVGRRIWGPKLIPQLGEWQRELVDDWGEVEAGLIAARVQSMYDRLYEQRPRFADRALRMHFEEHILPGIALYKTLLQAIGVREEALAQVETLFAASTTADARYKGIELLGRLPAPFAILRALNNASLRRDFPSAGWDIERVEDNDKRLAYNIHSCFYKQVLTSYDVPELTPLFCKSDDILFGRLPACIRWERTKTLGRGDDMCDFAFSYMPDEAEDRERVGAGVPDQAGAWRR